MSKIKRYSAIVPVSGVITMIDVQEIILFNRRDYTVLSGGPKVTVIVEKIKGGFFVYADGKKADGFTTNTRGYKGAFNKYLSFAI